MRNPLHKRFGRQLVHESGKYLGIFVLLVVSISLVAGFLATVASIRGILTDMDEANAIEDARFETSEPIDGATRAAVQGTGAEVYDNWSRDAAMTVDGADATVRLYINRSAVDTPSYYEGKAPESDDELSLDRTFCNNHGIHVGDVVAVDGKDFTVCGIMVLPDYTALMHSNSDFAMDAITFCVGQVSEVGFDRFFDLATSYTYSVVFSDPSLSVADCASRESDILQALVDNGAEPTDMLDRDQNQGISYLAEDMQGDGAMYTVFFYVLIVIMGFVFVILTNATIERESSVIGTLLASGWRKGEILRHYLFLPSAVGLAACILGNVLGYSLFSGVAQGIYYNSYSIPPFHLRFDAGTFVLTSVVPFALLVGITFTGLARKLGATPLAFLRHEVSHGKRRHNLRLPAKMGYVNRFRLRLVARNAPMFATLLFGVFAGSFLVMFSLVLMPVFVSYANDVADSMPTDHIYTLKAPYELQMTDRQQDPHPIASAGANSQEAIDQAEKTCLSSLQVERRGGAGMEDVTVYGVSENSRYWSDVDVSDGRVVVGAGLLQKCGLQVGGTIELYDKYADESYTLAIDGTNDNTADTSVYMSRSVFNETFDKASDWFNGYASDEALAIDAGYLASTTTPDDMRALADQMVDSFGNIVQLLLAAAALVFFVVMYLLTKTVIDHSARSISYMKVFGYRDREIRRLYLNSITLAVAVLLVVVIPLVMWSVSAVIDVIMLSYSGNFVVQYTPAVVAKDLAIGLATYLVVAALHMRHIKRVPLALALKAQE